MALNTDEERENARLNEIKAAEKYPYPIQLLDEAVRVALQVGPTEAARVTGVKIAAIKEHAILGGKRVELSRKEKPKKKKIPEAIRREIFRQAVEMQAATQKHIGECFTSIAVRHGYSKMAGASLCQAYRARYLRST